MTLLTARKTLLLSAALLAGGVLTALAASSAHAQTTVFTDRASFTAATSGLTTIDFNDQLAAGQASLLYAGGTATFSGVTFTSSQSLFAVSQSPGYDLGDGTVLSFQPGDPRTLTVLLPTGTTALGLDFGSFTGNPFTFALSNGSSYTYTGTSTYPTVNPPVFFGVTSVAPITSLVITSAAGNGGYPGGSQIDRFAFGTAATAATAVPEPSEYAVGGMFGATLLFGMVRARRKKVAASA